MRQVSPCLRLCILIAYVAVFGASSALAAEPEASPAKKAARAAVVERRDLIGSLGRQVWEFAEPAFQEHRSSALLAKTLEDAGFRVSRGVAEMPTAFVAEYGSGKPVVALLAEYDALPGLAQAADPVLSPIPRQQAGHGCGHNLFGAAVVGAALSVKDAMEQHKLGGTLRVYGCPAEEGGCGKAYMVRAGELKDVDVALHWHPGSSNSANMRTSLAIVRFRCRFTGVSAHAAGSPHLGRSALDAVELMNTGINFLREHVTSSARIHYVITDGGKRPNVVPQQAEAWYYIRAPKMSEAQAIFARVKKIAEGASLMTETKHELRMITGSYEILVNEPLARAMDANLRAVGDSAVYRRRTQIRRRRAEGNERRLEARRSAGLDDHREVRRRRHERLDRCRRRFLDRADGRPRRRHGRARDSRSQLGDDRLRRLAASRARFDHRGRSLGGHGRGSLRASQAAGRSASRFHFANRGNEVRAGSFRRSASRKARRLLNVGRRNRADDGSRRRSGNFLVALRDSA
ncbi:MAG: amidohydrolase [Pirellulales bacterium]